MVIFRISFSKDKNKHISERKKSFDHHAWWSHTSPCSINTNFYLMYEKKGRSQ